jgi:anti-sigma B factor antagonist
MGPQFTEFDIACEYMGAYCVVEVRGEVDVYTAPKLREQLHQAVHGGAHAVVVDAAGIEFIDSSGLGVLVGVFKQLRRRRGVLAVAGAPENVAKMLRITGLATVFLVADSVAGAIEDLESLDQRTRVRP